MSSAAARKGLQKEKLKCFHQRYVYTIVDPEIPSSLELLRIKYAEGDVGVKDVTEGPGPGREQSLDLLLRNLTEQSLADADDGDAENTASDHQEAESRTESLLIEAAEKGDAKTVKKVLGERNVNPDKKTKYQARSALHLACGYGQYDVAEQLLQAGADPMQFSYAGRTPLHEACQGGHPKVLGLLLDYTREVDSQDKDGQCPAHIAAHNGEVSCLDILHDRGASLVIEDRFGRQPAHMAAMRNHRSVLQLLYDKGIDLECADETGKLPVHYAAQYGAMSVMLCLIEHDCDITLGDHHGNLPMHYAAWHDHLDLLRFLVKHGSLLDFTNGENKSAAHVAAHHGGVKALHWLLEKGADPNAKDVHGNTPCHYAAKGGQAACFNCLLSHGGDTGSKNHTEDDVYAVGKKAGHTIQLERAAKSEVCCPCCKKVGDFKRWEIRNRPPAVIQSVSDLKQQAFISPVPKLQKVPTQVQANSQKHQRAQGQKSLNPLHATERKGSALAGQVRPQSKVGLTQSKVGLTQSHASLAPHTQQKPTGGSTNNKKLPSRDLPAKYFGEYLEINDLYKFKVG